MPRITGEDNELFIMYYLYVLLQRIIYIYYVFRKIFQQTSKVQVTLPNEETEINNFF